MVLIDFSIKYNDNTIVHSLALNNTLYTKVYTRRSIWGDLNLQDVPIPYKSVLIRKTQSIDLKQ